jgi:hypothetical protein
MVTMDLSILVVFTDHNGIKEINNNECDTN